MGYGGEDEELREGGREDRREGGRKGGRTGGREGGREKGGGGGRQRSNTSAKCGSLSCDCYMTHLTNSTGDREQEEVEHDLRMSVYEPKRLESLPSQSTGWTERGRERGE